MTIILLLMYVIFTQLHAELDLESACVGRPWFFHTGNFKDVVLYQEGFEKLCGILLSRERGEFTNIDQQ